MITKLKISEKDLRKIVSEELKIIKENIDHESISNVVESSSKMLKAIESFKSSSPTHEMMNALTPHLDAITKCFEEMIKNPSSYISQQQAAKIKQVVKLRPQK